MRLDHLLKMFTGFFFFHRTLAFYIVLCSAGVFMWKWAIGTLLCVASKPDFHKVSKA